MDYKERVAYGKEKAGKMADKINKAFEGKFPHFVCNPVRILGQCVSINISLDDPSTWSYGYYDNSRHQSLLIHCDYGEKMEMSVLKQWGHNAKLRRKRNVPADQWEKMADYTIKQIEKLLVELEK